MSTDPGTPAWASSTAHYENFPVASALVPARLRPDIAAIYRFARYADDIADEGTATAPQRLAELDRLRDAVTGGAVHPVVEPLRSVMRRHAIPPRPFLDLLQAFAWDAAGRGFPDRASLLEYCRHSAEPVGRLVLRVFDADARADLAASDAVCTGLQLVNFVQDVGQDHARGRCYVPADELAAHGVDRAQIDRAVCAGRLTPPLRALLDLQLDQARSLLLQGLRLVRGPLPLRLRLELTAILAGALTVAARLYREDPLAARIKLGRRDLRAMLWQALTLQRMRTPDVA